MRILSFYFDALREKIDRLFLRLRVKLIDLRHPDNQFIFMQGIKEKGYTDKNILQRFNGFQMIFNLIV